jgi:3'-phosphoadenosine 5'-phosphosulfate sulfotransferase (PAPS reductase)/FAD synthetase
MIDERGARLYARLSIHRRHVEHAHDIVRRTFEVCASPFVACSFGKDSAALLHLVMQHRPDIEARFIRWPETNLLGDYERVIAEWQQRGARITVLDLTRATLDDKVPGRWDALRNTSPTDGQFVGLRSDESRTRAIMLSTQGALYRTAAGYWRSCPLARWTTLDVAAYVVTHGLPTLTTYVRHGFEARTSSRVPRAAHSIREKELQRLREDDPVAFQRLKEMFPEVMEAS